MANRCLPRAAGPVAYDEVRRDPLAFLAGQIERTGEIFEYEMGGFRAVFLGRPAYVKHVLQTHARNYLKTGTPDLMMLEPMLGTGLMTSEGEPWAEQRRMILPAFHRERIDELVGVMTEVTNRLCDAWSVGGTLDAEGEMSRLTLQVIARGLFGFELDDSSAGFAGAVAVMNEIMARFDPDDPRKRIEFGTARATVARITRQILDCRRAGGARGHDLLTLLLDARHEDGAPLTDAEIGDQIFTFLMAGHETTAKTLTWTLYLIDQHPDVRARLREEAQRVLSGQPTAGELERLDYTWMILQEAMRLYPPVWLMSRVAHADDTLDGYRIPAGTLVIVSPWVLHRDARYWSDPLVFDPERFSAARAPQINEYVYFPFSGGPRACIGRRFATVEMKLVLALISRRFELHKPPDHPVEPEALVTLRPRFGMPMRVLRAS